MNTEWANLREPHERLRWARQAAEFSTIRSAADALSMKEGTYRQYESEPGSSRWAALDHQLAMAAGRKFKVSWTWLLLGEGSPFEKVVTEAQQRVIDAMARADEPEQERVAAAVEALLKRTGTDG